VIRLGAFVPGNERLSAVKQAVRTKEGTFEIKRLGITSQQNDFRGSITHHLKTIEDLERLVVDAEDIDTGATAEEEDVEKVGEDCEGTSAGTAITATDATAEEEDIEKVAENCEGASAGTATASPKPKKTMTIEIDESYNTPIVYRSNNRKKQVLLKVPRSTTESSFHRNMHRTKFLDNLLENLGTDVEESTKWLLGALAKKSDKLYEEVARERGFITTQTKKMDAHSAAAMWEDANVNTGQSRTILRHFDAYFGLRLTVPESQVKAAANDPDVLAAKKRAIEKTSRKRKVAGPSLEP
jgi:hypothetical protein